jgi:sulfoacetaldehyde acetyltransferase
MLRRAIREANTDPKGPTHVDIPRDFLYESVEVEMWPSSAYQPSNRILPDNEAIGRVSELLAHSKSPAIIAGGGVVWSNAEREVCEAARLLSAPIATTYGHNDAVSNDFPLFVGSLGRGGSKAAMRLLAKADVILAVGTRLDPFTVIPYYGFSYMPKDAKIIQVDVDPRQIGRNFPCEIGIVSDANCFLERLNQSLKNSSSKRQGWIDEIEKEKKEWVTELEQSVSMESSPMLTERAYKVLRDNLPDNVIVTTDVGSTPSFAYSVLRYKFSHLLAPLGLGGVGFALPAALGAKLARPEEKVVALLGDGAFTMEMNNLLTAKEYGIAVTAIVFNNKAWGAEKANQLHFYESRFMGTNLESDPQISSIAKALGVASATVETPEELTRALREALAGQQSYVIEVMIDRTSFPLPARRDALKKPARRIYLR